MYYIILSRWCKSYYYMLHVKHLGQSIVLKYNLTELLACLGFVECVFEALEYRIFTPYGFLLTIYMT